MKKVILCLAIFVVIIGLICTVFVGCDDNTAYATNENGSCFIVVYEDYLNHYKVVYDKETKVMYTLSDGQYNRGNFVMLVNSDGTPKLYEGN